MSEPTSPLVAIIAIELLAFEGKLHSRRTNWACPFHWCKQDFPTAKALMQHVPFCEHFMSRGVFCNLCDDWDCFENHDIPTSPTSPTHPPAAKTRTLQKVVKILSRIPVSRSSSSPTSESESESEGTQTLSSSQSQNKMFFGTGSNMYPDNSIPPDFLLGSTKQSTRYSPTEMSGTPTSHSSNFNPLHKLPSTQYGLGANTYYHYPLENGTSPYQYLAYNDTKIPLAEVSMNYYYPREFVNNDEQLIWKRLNETAYPTNFNHDECAQAAQAQNFSIQENHSDMNCQYPVGVALVPTALEPRQAAVPELDSSSPVSELQAGQFLMGFSQEQVPYPPLPSTGSFHGNHQAGSQDPSPSSDWTLPSYGSQSVACPKAAQNLTVSIPGGGQGSANPCPLPPRSVPSSASRSSIASQYSPYSAASYDSSQTSGSPATDPSPSGPSLYSPPPYSPTPAGPTSAEAYEQDGQTFICPICGWSPNSKGKRQNFPTYLRKHCKKHEPKQVQCPICEKMFGRKDNMKVHMENLHPDSKFPNINQVTG
ncbi:unnamed protein product [Clonostachys rosea]|uniref:C2H2-type domain-containing protein n=1 Tax=Bionectria ochroleuca TaxID=29856 RepID=A0ABY6UJ79_BIOOC|nr:unnamed protein product [Clonostachys rosea]